MNPSVTISTKMRLETAQKATVCEASRGPNPTRNDPCHTTSSTDATNRTMANPYRTRFFISAGLAFDYTDYGIGPSWGSPHKPNCRQKSRDSQSGFSGHGSLTTNPSTLCATLLMPVPAMIFPSGLTAVAVMRVQVSCPVTPLLVR